MIPRETIEEIVRRSDIVQVINQYVELKRAGSNYVGLCPFHSEKSPSFTVFPNSDSFYCFGCGAGGDAITFIKKQENLDYVSAVELLASRAGVTIPEDTDYRGTQGPTRERIRQMNTDAAKFFHSCLMNDPAAEPAREYLKKRNLIGSTIKHFYLGYAPGNGRLTAYLKKLGYTEDELTAGFLSKKNQNGRLYDLFFNRVMFPIVDTSRNIIAFGGRVLDDSKPKYLNTSDTPAFKKSKNLFALNYAKDFCSEKLIVCEGYMDVVTMHQAGFQNSVATLGTAITDEHARVLAKYTGRVILSYDSDEAGIKATNRAMAVLGNVGVDVRVLTMNGAKDPDEYIKKFGAEAFGRLLDGSATGFDYKYDVIVKKYNVNNTDEKIRAVGELTSVIASYHSSVEREVYINKTSEKLGVSKQSLTEDVEKARRRQQKKVISGEMEEARANISRYSDRINPDAGSNIRAVAAEEIILGLLLLYPEHREAVANHTVDLDASDFCTDFSKKVFEKIMELNGSEGGFLFSLLGEDFDSDAMGKLESMEMSRRELTQNGNDVLLNSIETLKRAKTSKAEEKSFGLADSIAEKRRKLEEERKKRS